MNFAKGNLGWIEVVCGPMFSGKSEELIRRLRRAEIARQRVQIFKPGIDERYANDHIVSHSELRIRSVSVKDAADVESRLDLRTEVIGIDEAQFLEIVTAVDRVYGSETLRRFWRRGRLVANRARRHPYQTSTAR